MTNLNETTGILMKVYPSAPVLQTLALDLGSDTGVKGNNIYDIPYRWLRRVCILLLPHIVPESTLALDLGSDTGVQITLQLIKCSSQAMQNKCTT